MFFSFSSKANDCHKTFGSLGTSIHHGQPHKGVEKAYSHLEKKGLWKKFKSKDFGVLPLKDSLDIYKDLFEKTSDIIEKGFRPALIGGDHSQSFSTISALLKYYPNLKVLWVDAHADINTRNTSPSNNIHGMPVAGLMGIMKKESWNRNWLNTQLSPENLIYIGIRDLDPKEIEFIEKYKIKNYPQKTVQEKGIKNILSEINKKWKGEPIHLSFDIDALDSSLVPATAVPSPKGITLNEAVEIINWVKPKLVSFELVEFNPELAKTQKELEQTEKSVEKLLENLLGSS